MRSHVSWDTAIRKAIWAIRDSYRFFYFLFHISFYISRYNFLHIFRTSCNIIWKRFFSQILLFTRIHPNPHPLNSQNLLSMTKVFCQISLKCLLNFFKNICWQNPAKASFMYQQWTATVHIFLNVPTTGYLVFIQNISQEQLF